MVQASESDVKKVRTRKPASSTPETEVSARLVNISKSPNPLSQIFSDLLSLIREASIDFEKLQKDISETQEVWLREQNEHSRDITERDHQEEVERKREQETYFYNTSLTRKRDEDSFNDKKVRWEKELSDKKAEIEKEKQELVELRKTVANFENEKEKAVKEALASLQRQLTEKSETERKLGGQEVRAEKEILNLKITNLTTDNKRQASEIEILKKSLEQTTKEIKEIAVSVIEARSNQNRVSPASVD